MKNKSFANRVVDAMYEHDAFSKWLGIRRIEEGEGFAVVSMTVRKEMLNGFYIAHGGITFSLADSAFAFASNSHGQKSVSIETTISHLVKVEEGDILTAKATQISRSKKIGIYQVEIHNQHNVLVAHFKGTVYQTSRKWFEEE